jgi:hypothetical protein
MFAGLAARAVNILALMLYWMGTENGRFIFSGFQPRYTYPLFELAAVVGIYLPGAVRAVRRRVGSSS